MFFKPKDFFIGVVDFFSVIVPGALVTYFLMGQVDGDVFGAGKAFPLPETQTQGWIVFLVATYIIGNIIFLISSLLLDKYVYDRYLRKRFTKNFDLAYHTATAIRNQYIHTDSWINQHTHDGKLSEKEGEALLSKKKCEIINTFKWGQKFLFTKYPETLTDIKKIVADSKLFRSLVVAFFIMGLVLLANSMLSVNDAWLTGVCFLILSLLSLFRYSHLRYKSTQQTYDYIITIHHLEKGKLPDSSAQSHDNRVDFLKSDKEISNWKSKISQLTKGMRVTTEMLSIPKGDTWKVKNSPDKETLFCLSGRCVAKVGTGDDMENKVILSPNAIMPIPTNSSFQILNNRQESLLLLAIQQLAI